jgi:hypothetical protein
MNLILVPWLCMAAIGGRRDPHLLTSTVLAAAFVAAA